MSSYPTAKRSTIQSFVDAVDQKIKGFAESVKNGDKTFRREKISDVSDRAATDIGNLLGIDASGYTHNINTNGMQHIINRHGENGAHDSTMANDNDIARVGWVLENYDTVEIVEDNGQQKYSAEFRDSDNNPAPQIRFIKKIDGTYYVVEAACENQYKKLWVQSAYLQKNEDVTQVPTADKKISHERHAQSELASPSSVTSITDEVAGVNGENVDPLMALAAQKVDMERAAEEEMSSAEGRAILGDEVVDIADITDAGNGKVTVKLTDGSTADAAALSFPEAGEAELWRVIGQYAEDAESARALLEEYRNGSLDAYTYARGVEEAFLYGKVNLSEKEMDLRGSLTNLLSPSQRREAYIQGRIAGEKKAQQQKKDASQHDTKRRRKGAVHYGYEGQQLDKSKLKATQKVGVDFAERMAAKKGITFYFYRSFDQNGVRVFKNAKGEIVPAQKNGWYDPSDGSIHIDLNSGDMGSTVLFTIAHELTHWMKDVNLTRYRELCGIVTEGFLERGQSVEQLVKNKMEEYRKANVELTWEEAYDEVIASSLEGVLSDGRVMDLLDAAETKSLTLWEQLKSFLEDVATLIHETIQAYRNLQPESPEGRMVQRMKELHAQIQDVFAAGIHEGGEDFREGGKINTVHKDGVKNSIRMTEDGIKYVKLDGNIFRRFDGTEMSQTEAYNALVGKKITLEDGDIITFIKKLPGRSVYNELFKKLPGYDPGIDVKAVSQAINRNMVEIVEASTVQTRNEPQRHPHIGIKDFDQREVYLVDGQSVYRMELCIANLTDGTKIAYVKRFIANPSADVVAKIKKAETAVQNRLNQPSKSSIRNSKPNVNKNSLRYQKNEAAQTHMAAQDASLAEDMEGLQAFVALQKQQGRQAKMETAATNAAATFLMKTAGAKGDKSELMNLLDGFYRYVASTELQSWESVREKAMPVVRWLMKNTVRTKQRSEYAQDVLNTLHGSRVSLDETQKNEVAHIYGSFSAFRNTVMGSITLVNDGISLDSQWQEWAEMYPDLFDENMTATDMPEALSDIIHRMRNDNTSELEYEYSRDFIEQELLSRVYDSYWNASTLYSVADHYEGQLKQLKAKHRQRMQTVYARHQEMEAQQRDVHRMRQEAAKSHYEERYQRREAEYRESRRQAGNRLWLCLCRFRNKR